MSSAASGNEAPGNVLFINEYLELKQLLEYLTLSDIYLFTSKDPNQAVSGTLAYAMSCGCAVISNPIPHAIETLDGGTGVLLERFGEPEEFQKEILKLIENKEERIAMARNAFSSTHATTWENIAIKYGLLFGELTNRTEDLRFSLPPIKLDHIKELTTDYGILQFSKFSQPDPESGYTLDDNARALINMVMHYKYYEDGNALKLANIYLSLAILENALERYDMAYRYIDQFLTMVPGNVRGLLMKLHFATALGKVAEAGQIIVTLQGIDGDGRLSVGERQTLSLYLERP